MNLTAAEIMIVLKALAAKYGPGYSSDPDVGRLQAKLSVWLEVRKADGTLAEWNAAHQDDPL